MHYTATTLAFLMVAIGFPAILIAQIIIGLTDIGLKHCELVTYLLLGTMCLYMLFSKLCFAYMNNYDGIEIDYSKRTNIGICYLPFAIYLYKSPSLEEQAEQLKVKYARFIAEAAKDWFDSIAQVGVERKSDDLITTCEAVAEIVEAAQSTDDLIPTCEAVAETVEAAQSTDDLILTCEAVAETVVAAQSTDDLILTCEAVAETVVAAQSTDDLILTCEAVAETVVAAQSTDDLISTCEAVAEIVEAAQSTDDLIPTCEAVAETVEAAQSTSDLITIGEAAAVPSDANDGVGYIKLIRRSSSSIGAASNSGSGRTVGGFSGNTHDYSDSYSTFELDFSPASDALSLGSYYPDAEQDFVLVGDVDVLPALSRVDSHLVKYPKAFIRRLIPVLRGCQEWRARNVCSKSFEIKLWTLEYCCKPTIGSEHIEKLSWLSFRSNQFASLDDALNRYTAQKVLGRLNLSTCVECGKVNLGGQKRARAIAALPPILTIQLVSPGGMLSKAKDTKHMRFTAEFDMRPYIRHSRDRTQKTIYSLFLVVARDGGSGRKGNCTSFARSSSNNWYRCRAGYDPEEVREDVVLAANACMLVYTLVY